MKILNLAESYLSDDPASIAGIHVHRQNMRLYERGWDIRVINPQALFYRLYKGVSKYYPAQSKRDSISIWRPWFAWYPGAKPGKWVDASFCQGIVRILPNVTKNWKPDLVVCDWFLPGAKAAVHIAKKYDIPLIFKLHGGDIRAVSKLLRDRPRIREYFVNLALPAQIVIANGYGLYYSAIRTGIFEEKRVLNIPIGVDTNIFYPIPKEMRASLRQQFEIPLDAKVILFAGSWGQGKGSQDLCGVLPALFSRFDKLHFLVAGRIDDEKSYNELIGLNNPRRSQGRIRFYGQIEASRVATLMQLSDIFVLPSYREGLPSALLEAMACEMVPIVSAVDGMPYVIKHDENGLLIQPGDQVELERALTHCIEETEYCNLLANAALKTIIDEGYSLNAVGQKLHEVYSSCLKTPITRWDVQPLE